MAFRNIPPNGFPAIPDIEDLEAVVKDVNGLKSSVSRLTEDVSDLNDNKANQITIAPFFNSETSYDVGDLVYYNGLSYRCTNAHEGEWDADDFAPTTIANELSSLMSGFTYKQGDIVTYGQFTLIPCRFVSGRTKCLITLYTDKVISHFTSINFGNIIVFAPEESKACTVAVDSSYIYNNVLVLLVDITPESAWTTTTDTIGVVQLDGTATITF